MMDADRNKHICGHGQTMSNLLKVVQDSLDALGKAVENLSAQHHRELAGEQQERKPTFVVDTSHVTYSIPDEDVQDVATRPSLQSHLWNSKDSVPPARPALKEEKDAHGIVSQQVCFAAQESENQTSDWAAKSQQWGLVDSIATVGTGPPLSSYPSTVTFRASSTQPVEAQHNGSSKGRVVLRPNWEKVPESLLNSRTWNDVDAQSSTQNSMLHHQETDLGDQPFTSSSPSKLQVGLSRCMMTPSNSLRLFWDMCGGILLAFHMVTVPLDAFNIPENTVMSVFDWSSLFFWTIDMPFTFFVGYQKGGVIVMSPRDIASHYLKTWFFADLVLVLMDWFLTIGQQQDVEISGFARTSRVVRAFRMLRFLRLFKLRRLLGEMNELIFREYSSAILRLVYLTTVVVFMNHIVACLWFWIADSNTVSEETWLTGHQMLNASIEYQYVSSLHWSLTQFTPATQNIHPHSLNERFFAAIIVVISIVTFATIVGSITNTMSELQNIGSDEVKDFNLLRRYLGQENVKKSLQRRIVKYLEYAYRHKKTHLETGSIPVLQLLSDPLRDELHYDRVAQHICAHAFFAFLQSFWLLMLQRISVSACDHRSFASNDVIFSPGIKGTRMYFVTLGTLAYTSCAGADAEVQVKVGDWAAEASLWCLWQHRGLLQGQSSAEVICIEAKEACAEIVKVKFVYMEARKYAKEFAIMINSDDQQNATDVLQDYTVGEYITKMPVVNDSYFKNQTAFARRAVGTSTTLLAFTNQSAKSFRPSLRRSMAPMLTKVQSMKNNPFKGASRD